MEENNKSGRGGKREGAGRPKGTKKLSEPKHYITLYVTDNEEIALKERFEELRKEATSD